MGKIESLIPSASSISLTRSQSYAAHFTASITPRWHDQRVCLVKCISWPTTAASWAATVTFAKRHLVQFLSLVAQELSRIRGLCPSTSEMLIVTRENHQNSQRGPREVTSCLGGSNVLSIHIYARYGEEKKLSVHVIGPDRYTSRTHAAHMLAHSYWHRTFKEISV